MCEAVIKYGYKIQLIKGYEFSKVKLFDKYVDHFYNLKILQVQQSLLLKCI